MMEAIDKFNKELIRIGAEYTLSEDQAQLDDNYLLYIAKKKGIPKSDYSSKFKSDSV